MIGAQKCDRCGFAFNTCPCRDKPSSRDVAAVGGVNPNGFACGRCDECDGGRGHLFCLRPRGGSRPHDVAAAGGGEQSLTAAEFMEDVGRGILPTELEVVALRADEHLLLRCRDQLRFFQPPPGGSLAREVELLRRDLERRLEPGLPLREAERAEVKEVEALRALLRAVGMWLSGFTAGMQGEERHRQRENLIAQINEALR